jgi:hypothetical protein
VSGKDLDAKGGLVGAYDKELHAIDLRALVTPDLEQLFNVLGLPTTGVCEPIMTQCELPGGLYLPPDLGSNAQKEAPPLKPKALKPGGLRGLIRSISAVFG